MKKIAGKLPSLAVAFATIVFLGAPVMRAQNMGWEGETGIFVTPLAWTAASPADGWGKPMVGFHFLNGGPVIGDFYETSVTEGMFSRFEWGYTRAMHSAAGTPDLSPLWTEGFNIVHAKANLIPENMDKHNWVPAISTGFMLRSQVREVGGVINGKDTVNGDIYVVATKLVTQTKALPLVFNVGVRGTNAVLWGMGGNSPDWEAKVFGAAGFVVKLPHKASAILGAELSQQPKHPEGLPTADIPTTLTYAVRLSPAPESKLNVDFGVAQIAGEIIPGVNLQSRHQFGMQVSYGF